MKSASVVSWVRLASFVLVSAVVVAPALLDQVASLRLFSIALGVLALCAEIWSRAAGTRWKLYAGVGTVAYSFVVLLITEVLATNLEDRNFAVNAQHLFILLPVYGLLGFLLYKSSNGQLFIRILLGMAGIVATIAIVEALTGMSLTGREYEFATSQREGLPRALATAENALTLGATLATLVPLTLKLTPGWHRVALAALLAGGAWATGSRAPALICTAILAVQFIPIMPTLVRRYARVFYAIAAAVVGCLAVMSMLVWKPYIEGDTGLEYSTNYRGALYSLLPEVLVERPFGYLLATPTQGRWMVASELHGSFDITRSLDSEIAFAIFGLGWVGLAFYLGALTLSVLALRTDVALGFSALTITALGVTMALHSWDGMSVLWYGLIGACANAACSRFRRPRVTGSVGTQE